MATSRPEGGGEVKEEHKPRVHVKLTRTQILRQKITHKSDPASPERQRTKNVNVSSAVGHKNKMSVLETTKTERKSKSATHLGSDVNESEHIKDDAAHVKETTQAESSGAGKRKTTKPVNIRDSLSPRIKRRELSSESKPSPVLSPVLSGAKLVQKSQSHDAIHTRMAGDHVARQAKSGNVSSMVHLSDSRSSILSDASMDSTRSGSARRHNSRSPSGSLDRRSSSSGLSKNICITAQIVTDRLYTPTNVNEKRNFLKRKQWLLPDPQRRSRKSHQDAGKNGPKKKETSVEKLPSTDDISETFREKALSTEDIPDACYEASDISGLCHEYDWLNRSAHSDSDLTANLNRKKKEARSVWKRRRSDPLPYNNDPYCMQFDRDVEEGFSRNGVFFLREYFRRDLEWLSTRIDSFLSRRNLLPHYPAATNEEWYLTETRPVITKPSVQEDATSVAAVADQASVVVDAAGTSDAVAVEDVVTSEKPPEMTDAWTETWPQKMMCDVATMTSRPQMYSRTTLTEPIYCDQQTSTDDIGGMRIKCHQSTSTVDLFDDVYSGSPTPTASPIDTDAESSSAYGSYESGNLRRQLHYRGSMSTDKSEGFTQTDSELLLKLHGDSTGDAGKMKPRLTEEETTKIQSELNRLARERIEIIELFALNVGSLSPTFTEELLEAKLNYSIGQTDQLLALLENAWNVEDTVTSTPRDSMCLITQEIIQQSRNELEHSKKVIRLCIDEVRQVKKGGSRRSNFHEEIKKMKRKAEIEAFKLERMWEQLLYERLKNRKPLSDPAYSTFEQHASYLQNLRNRSISATSERNHVKSHTSSVSRSADVHRESLNDSVDSYLGMPGYLRPYEHEDHLMELRRLLITEHDHPPRTSKSKSASSARFSSPSSRLTNMSSAGLSGITTSTTRFGHIYPSNPVYSSYSSKLSKTSQSSDKYRSSSQTSHSTLYSTPWGPHREPVTMTSSYDKYKPYTGKYQTTIT